MQHKVVQRQNGRTHPIRQHTPQRVPAQFSYGSCQSLCNARAQTVPVDALHQRVRKEQRCVQPLCNGMSDGSPQARYFDKTIDAVGNVCCPLHSLILYIRPWDGVQTVTQLLADQLPDLVPVALLYGINNAVKEWILRRKVEVRGNAVCSTTAPAAAIVGLLVQHVQFVKGGQFTISVLDLLRCAARRRSDAVHSLGCSGAGGDCAPGKERHQPRNVTEHHRRRICQRSQRGGKYLNDGRGCRGRCALQVAERRPQAGRRQQRRSHPVRQRPEPGGKHIEHQRAGHQPCQPLAEVFRALRSLCQPFLHTLGLAFHKIKSLAADRAYRGQ